MLLLLVALAALVHGARLGTLSIRGEEPRRALVAGEMLASGDFVVPRQQGLLYLSRPPLQNWTIALAAWLTGRCDAAVVRLPALLATVATTGLIYLCARACTSRAAAFVAGAAYATMFQVLELGRMAETEATLTLLIASSLLVWQAGYVARWRPVFTWSTGYTLAALAGLAKGPQGPVYFVAVTTVYLLAVRRDWRMWLSVAHLAGLVAFAAVIGAWQIPYWRAAGPEAAWEIWVHNASIRFLGSQTSALSIHAASFPLHVFACTMPWSALLVAYAWPSLRRNLGDSRSLVVFAAVALLVTLPSCLLAIEARPRYFMPLYPCLAVLTAPVVEAALGQGVRRAASVWFHWQGLLALGFAGVAIVMLGASLSGGGRSVLVQPPLFACGFAAYVAVTAVALFVIRSRTEPARVVLGTSLIMGLLGLSYAGARINELARNSEDHLAAMNQLRTQLPRGAELVSFGLAHHLFTYHYGKPISTVAWPTVPEAVPPQVEYFCYEDFDGYEEPPLPFAWEPLAVISCERYKTPHPAQRMIVGRRITSDTAAVHRSETSNSRSHVSAN
ncbi:MAG: glycosyltransferase family 39 protein [Pirellulales bacterium]|nr:glycosyltransferase family 39 protein [Pirellulales bacterium]